MMKKFDLLVDREHLYSILEIKHFTSQLLVCVRDLYITICGSDKHY